MKIKMDFLWRLDFELGGLSVFRGALPAHAPPLATGLDWSGPEYIYLWYIALKIEFHKRNI